jgi:hypothetical protein
LASEWWRQQTSARCAFRAPHGGFGLVELTEKAVPFASEALAPSLPNLLTRDDEPPEHPVAIPGVTKFV